jgi:hypothetical protein
MFLSKVVRSKSLNAGINDRKENFKKEKNSCWYYPGKKANPL